MSADCELITVEVAYAEAERQELLRLEVRLGTTLAEAVMSSGICERFKGVDMSEGNVGIFGQIKSPDTVLKPGDRVEIYRPMICDPKEVRRQRAKTAKIGPS